MLGRSLTCRARAALVPMIFLVSAGLASAQQPYQSTAGGGAYPHAVSVRTLPTVWLSVGGNWANDTKIAATYAIEAIENCERAAFQSYIANLRERVKVLGSDGERYLASDPEYAQKLLNDANSVASIINWLIAKSWRHCNPPTRTAEAPEPIRPAVQGANQVRTGDAPVPVLPPPAVPRTFEPAPADLPPGFGSGPFFGVGVRHVHGTSLLSERLNATGAETARFRQSSGGLGVTGEFGYIYALNSNAFVGLIASLTATDRSMVQRFPGGTSLGATLNGYGALTGQAGYWINNNIALFVEGGGVIGNQNIQATFAPVFRETQFTPGWLAGGGVKLKLPALQQLINGVEILVTARYNHIEFQSVNGRPPGLFNYSGKTRADTFRVGFEFYPKFAFR